ncbi:MAG: hypothetical protein JXB24_02250 [Bacteroidales bacterium]|nr:hypothetical protein [Bacteroidales bacterium]
MKITTKELNILSEKAKESSGRRVNHNHYHQMDDTLPRMIHAIHRGTCIQLRKHEKPVPDASSYIT